MVRLWLHGPLVAGLAAAVVGAASACAPDATSLQCNVSGLELLSEAISADDICRSFADALGEARDAEIVFDAPGVGDWVELNVTVRSAYALSARLRLGQGDDVRDVPEMQLSIADRALGLAQIRHFTGALATAAARP